MPIAHSSPLGRALAKNRSMRVREFSADERVTLMRLTEQVEEIAKRLDTFPERGRDGVFRFESPKDGYRAPDGTQEGRLRSAKPPLTAISVPMPLSQQ